MIRTKMGAEVCSFLDISIIIIDYSIQNVNIQKVLF